MCFTGPLWIKEYEIGGSWQLGRPTTDYIRSSWVRRDWEEEGGSLLLTCFMSAFQLCYIVSFLDLGKVCRYIISSAGQICYEVIF